MFCSTVKSNPVVYGAAVEKGLAFSNDPRRRVSLSNNTDVSIANIVGDVVAHYNSFSPPAISSSSRLARCSSASPPALSHSLFKTICSILEISS